MSLAEFARLLDVEPKWVLNAITALGRRRRYTLDLARRLSVALAIHQGTGASLARSFKIAERALQAYESGNQDRVVTTDHDDVGIVPNINRILSSLNVRLSFLNTSFAPRVRGRPSGRRDHLIAAADWGIDLSLLRYNLAKTAEQRIRQLDAMAAFSRDVRRPAPVSG
jgi:hypothetical protein